MKESIFFNKEQLKVIRRYGILYQGFFKYGVIIFPFIFSVLLSFGVLAGGYFSSVFLFEGEKETWTSAAFSTYLEKQELVKSLSGLHAKLLNGKIGIFSGTLSSQDNLLSFSGLVLPRLTMISDQLLQQYAQGINRESFDDQYLNDFFSNVLMYPLKAPSFGLENPPLFALQGSLRDTFGLGCLEGATKHSFVCSSYVEDFLNRFFLYELNPWASIASLADEFEKSIMWALTPELWDELSWSTEELLKLYPLLKTDEQHGPAFCQGLLRYGQYGGVLDDQFSEIFRDCGSEDYAQFVLLRDFALLKKAFLLGYVDAKVYSDAMMNQYKLFSLQQLLFKHLSASADVKPLMQSYLGFLREILVREGNRELQLLGSFPKTFAYWYNMNIIEPYLKDEKSKMNKEDRIPLIHQLLSLNYGDKVANFVGLQTQARYTVQDSSSLRTEISTEQDLEKLFRSSYLPEQFTLISVKKGTGANSLIVEWVDKKTKFTLQANLKYENIQLSVAHLEIKEKKKLTEYLNALIAHDSYSLNKVLSLMGEHKDIAEQTQALDLTLCSQLQERYKQEMLSCSDTQVKIALWSGEQLADGTAKPLLIYTFTLKKGVLSQVELSDKLLETKLLKELDLSLVDASTTLYMVSSIVGYIPKEENSGFGMKEHLLVTDKFSKYLGIVPDTVASEGGIVKVSFAVGDLKFIGSYDIVKNTLNPLALDFWTQRRPVIIQGLMLTLKEDQLDNLNTFLLDPVAYLKKINSALVKKYFPEK